MSSNTILFNSVKFMCFFWLIHVVPPLPLCTLTPPRGRAGSEFTVDGRGTVIVLPNEDEVLEAIAVGVPAIFFAKWVPGIW